MKSFLEAFQEQKEVKRDPNLRRQLIKELYEIYQTYETDRRAKKIPTFSAKLFAIKLAHLTREDLYYSISQVRHKREKGFAWLFWSIKGKV